MESNLSCLSSLKEEDNAVYVQPHYKESYRLAIYALLCGGKEAYEEFLRAEQINHFLSEEEMLFMLENAELPVVDDDSEGRRVAGDNDDDGRPSTYFPIESDEEIPDLDLGWPELMLDGADTSISLLFHPPRQNTPTIKEVIRKQVQEARQIIAIAMDIFTDVDIFKEIISATLRGVVVYILLDEAHIKSFLTMSSRVGINIQDLKNLRVRTVRGQQYQCRSGIKFHGGLEQKFLLVDCQTVIYGTYSYSWSFEKINLSMVLVVTGQLVGSYDEEFRRLYARSTVPVILSNEKPAAPFMVHSPNSSQLSLNQIHLRSRLMPGMRLAQDDRLNTAGMLTRGLSMQERLHQSHCPDIGSLMRGHSYGEELQKLNSMTRLRMGTKDLGIPFLQERNGLTAKGAEAPLTNRLAQQHLRHQSRYGADHSLIPFNSETSLHRWKMDTYLNESDKFFDASCEALSPLTSPLTSPYSSRTGLNEHQSQLIHGRTRDIKSRMEEMRQKRLSLQEYANLRQSQESLRSMYPTDRSKFMPTSRNPDMRQSMVELDPKIQNGAPPEDSRLRREGDTKQQTLTAGHRSVSHNDVKIGPDRRTDWSDPRLKTTSAAELDKLNEAAAKLAQLQQASALGIQHPRPMESLTEIPEEKEGSNGRVNSSDPALKEKSEEAAQEENLVPEEKSEKSDASTEPQSRDQSKGSRGSIHKVANSKDSGASRETKKSTSSEVEPAPKVPDVPPVPPHGPEGKSNHTEKGPTQREEAPLQRSNSLRKSLQRKSSFKLQNSSGSKSNHSQAPAAAEQGAKKSPGTPRSPTPQGGPSEAEKHKSPFSRLSSHRSSKKKAAQAAQAAEQDQGSSSTLDSAGTPIFQARREKAYSRFEYFLSNENIRQDKSDKEKGSSLSRQDSAYHQGQTADHNKLGRFMQRVGNLIHKNK